MGKRLSNKVALVFGAGSHGEGWGNGKATAVTFARQGAQVIAVDINNTAAEKTRDIIKNEGGLCIAKKADVTQSKDIANVVDEVIERFGQIDILHNNVGVTCMGSVIDLSEEDWQKSIQVNLTSVYLTMKHVLPYMVKQQSGTVINISSIASIRDTGLTYPAYNATKAALNQLTSVTALEYAKYNVRVNAIVPGFIDTPLIYNQVSSQYHSIDEMIADRKRQVPLGRMGTAFDIAHAALFLASDEANFITGVCLPVDGGQTMRC